MLKPLRALTLVGACMLAVQTSARTVQCERITAVKTMDCRKVKNGVCFINGSLGGDVEQIVKDAEKYRLVVVDGDCDSACAFAAEKFKDKVRLTPRATFGYHKIEVVMEERRGNKMCWYNTGEWYSWPHIDPVQKWIDAHGGEPRGRILRMPNKVARQIWQMWDPKEG